MHPPAEPCPHHPPARNVNETVLPHTRWASRIIRPDCHGGCGRFRRATPHSTGIEQATSHFSHHFPFSHFLSNLCYFFHNNLSLLVLRDFPCGKSHGNDGKLTGCAIHLAWSKHGADGVAHLSTGRRIRNQIVGYRGGTTLARAWLACGALRSHTARARQDPARENVGQRAAPMWRTTNA